MSQSSFRTIVPQQYVVVGESFQVQYILEDDEAITSLKPPAFSPFKLITGPNVYYGSVSTINGIKPLRNTVFTLVATRPGKFVIGGATAIEDGEMIRSNDVTITAITKEEAIRKLQREADASGYGYFLRPGDDPYKRIKEDLFLKVQVDRRSCYVGEPVLATFKLYSRLESRSDIVKNPGFYGFTVYDMINLSDKQVIVEKVNGKNFDVHTIRKVQLYPLQAGQFTIDPMEVKNKVEFSRSAVNKKAEQEIVEGILGFEDEPASEESEVFETDMSTEPVTIQVKPVPENSKPEGFNGAVGNYSIRAGLLKDKLKSNEQGILEIRISGKGNFTQLSPPRIDWPAGIEGFEPEVRDQLDKSQSPLTGSRVFRYAFVSSVPGDFTVPGVSFSFFKPDSGTYQTLSTNEAKLNISEARHSNSTPAPVRKQSKGSRTLIYILSATAFAIVLSGFLWKRNTKRKQARRKAPVKTESITTIDEILAGPGKLLNSPARLFNQELYHAVWKYFRLRFALTGMEMNRAKVFSIMQQKGLAVKPAEQLMDLLDQIRTSLYTEVGIDGSTDENFSLVYGSLQQIDAELFS